MPFSLCIPRSLQESVTTTTLNITNAAWSITSIERDFQIVYDTQTESGGGRGEREVYGVHGGGGVGVETSGEGGCIVINAPLTCQALQMTACISQCLFVSRTLYLFSLCVMYALTGH